MLGSALGPRLSLRGFLSDHSGTCVCSVTSLEPFNASFLGEVYISQLETQTEYRRRYSARVKKPALGRFNIHCNSNDLYGEK